MGRDMGTNPWASGLVAGLVSVTFRRLSPDEIIGLVSRAGLRAIEWGGDVHVSPGDMTTARRVYGMMCDSGLATAAYGSYYRVGQSEQAGLPFERVLDTALALGAPTIRVWAGTKGSAQANAADYEMVVRESRRVGDMARSAKVTVSYEYHGGTLTDTNASARTLVATVNHPNVRAYWQPPNGGDVEYCLEGLAGILPWLTNVHVFHWWPTAKDRRGLHEGQDRWIRYLRLVARDGRTHGVLLEFVRDDDPQAFLKDAQTLRNWLEYAGETLDACNC